MVAPFVLPAIPIVTTVGRFAVPYLAKELAKIGTNKFVQTYGNEAFTSLNETLANNTSMVNTEAMPMVNPNYKSQQESKPNIAAFAGDLAIPGYIAPDAAAIQFNSVPVDDKTCPEDPKSPSLSCNPPVIFTPSVVVSNLVV